MNNPNIEANALGNLGNTLRSLCLFEEASQMCRQQLQIWRELGNRLINLIILSFYKSFLRP